MMTKKLAQAFVLTMTILAGAASATAAPKVQNISIDVFPYVASLGQNAVDVERDLATEAARVCGTLDNVSRLDDLTLVMKNIRAFQVNPTGIPGSIGRDKIFDLAYPRVQGSAKVVCKN